MAVLVSRAEDHIRLPYRLEELGKPLRIVRKIGVHLEHQVVLSLEGPSKPGDVRGSKTKLRRPVNDVNGGVVGRDAVDDRPSSVGRSVVHYQDFERWILRENRGDQSCNIEALVVGRDDDQRAIRQVVSGRAGLRRPASGIRGRSKST